MGRFLLRSDRAAETARTQEQDEGDAPTPRRFLNFTKLYNFGSDLLHCLLGAFLLAACAAVMVDAAPELVHLFSTDSIMQATAELVDKMLFIMLILEIGHTVLISYKEHVIRPEPFLVVGIIASIRRILALTIMVADFHPNEEFFRMAMIETGILSVLILILVAAIIMIRHWSRDVRYEKFEQGDGRASQS